MDKTHVIPKRSLNYRFRRWLHTVVNNRWLYVLILPALIYILKSACELYLSIMTVQLYAFFSSSTRITAFPLSPMRITAIASP